VRTGPGLWWQFPDEFKIDDFKNEKHAEENNKGKKAVFWITLRCLL
jgi:hypothetical protein